MAFTPDSLDAPVLVDSVPTVQKIEEKNDEWKIVLRHFSQLDERIGRDVLTAFARCFVHADRLNSTLSCMSASMQQHGSDSIAYTRDLDAMVWFSIGTLRELAHSVGSLRTSLHKHDLLDPESDPWVELDRFEKRVRSHNLYQTVRNKVSFHVDDGVIGKGIEALVQEQEVTLSEGVGANNVKSSLLLGRLALHRGLGWDLKEYREFLEVVLVDHLGIGRAVQHLFLLAADKAGVRVAWLSLEQFTCSKIDPR